MYSASFIIPILFQTGNGGFWVVFKIKNKVFFNLYLKIFFNAFFLLTIAVSAAFIFSIKCTRMRIAVCVFWWGFFFVTIKLFLRDLVPGSTCQAICLRDSVPEKPKMLKRV